jgi:outer membrane protein
MRLLRSRTDGSPDVPVRSSRAVLPLLLVLLSILAATTVRGAAEKPLPPAMTLLDAVEAALHLDPNLHLAREASLERRGRFQEARGTFDLTFTASPAFEHSVGPLTFSQRDFERQRRTLFRQLSLTLDEVADDLHQQLLAGNGLVFQECPRGLDIVIGGTSICISGLLRANQELLLKLSEGLGLEEAVAALVQFNRNNAEIIRDILWTQAFIQRELLRNAGTIPDATERRTLTLDLRLLKTYRNGVEVSPGILIEGSHENWAGKSMNPGLGGRGIPDSIRSSVGVTTRIPLGKGAGRLSVTAPENAARFNLEAAQASEAHAAADTVRRVALAYWNLVTAQERLSLLEESSRISERLDEIGSALVEAGELAERDLSHLRSRGGLIRASVAEARQAVIRARLTLANVVGLGTASSDLAPVASETFPDIPEDLDLRSWQSGNLLDLALRSRLDLASLRRLEDSAELLAQAAQVDLRRRTDLSFTIGYNGLKEWGSITRAGDVFSNMGSAISDFRAGPSARVSLNIDWPIENSVAKGRLVENRALARQSHIGTRDLERTISESVVRLLGSLERALAELRHREDAVAFYRQALESETEKFQSGEGSVIDVILAEEAQTQEQLNAVSAKQTVISLLTELRFEVGTLVSTSVSEGHIVVSDVRPTGWMLLP